MRTRNHARLAAVLLTCSFAGPAHAAPPSAAPPSAAAKPQYIARAPAPMAVPAPRAAATGSAAAMPAPNAPAASTSQVLKPANAAERATMVKAAEAMLASGEVEQVELGFAQLGQLGGPDVIKIVIARVRRGLPPQILPSVINVLVALRHPTVAAPLLELSLHRRWQVREMAVSALGKLGAKTAQAPLLYALEDPSAEVRAAAVQSLALVGDARALPALSLALDRKVDGAALALGKLGNVKELELMLGRARQGEVSSVEAGLHAMLQRTNLALPLKLKIVNELAKIGSPATTEVLTVWTQTWGGGDPRVLQALTASTGKVDAGAVAAKTTPASPPPSSIAAKGGKP